MLTREFIFFTQHLGRVQFIRYKARKIQSATVPLKLVLLQFAFFTQHFSRVQLLYKYKNLIKGLLLDEVFLHPLILLPLPYFYVTSL